MAGWSVLAAWGPDPNQPLLLGGPVDYLVPVVACAACLEPSDPGRAAGEGEPAALSAQAAPTVPGQRVAGPLVRV